VLKQEQELASRENIPLCHLISLALTQAIGVWSDECSIANRARHADRASFLEALNEVPDAPPPGFDKLPSN
jgi:hypothetical protein